MSRKYFRIVANIIRLFILISAVYFFSIKSYGYFVSALGVLATSMLLVMREKERDAKMPAGHDLSVNTLLFMHVSGYFFKFYSSINHYDDLVHFVGGFAGGYLGIALAVSYQIANKIKINYKFALLAAIAFVVTLGSLWEVFEYSVDQLHFFDFSSGTPYTNLQWGLADTMVDLRTNFLGSLLGAYYGILKYKDEKQKDLAVNLDYLVKNYR